MASKYDSSSGFIFVPPRSVHTKTAADAMIHAASAAEKTAMFTP